MKMMVTYKVRRFYGPHENRHHMRHNSFELGMNSKSVLIICCVTVLLHLYGAI